MHPEKKLWLHFLPVLTAAVVITLLSMITSVGIPYITDSFGLTSRQAPWINTAGTMASAVLAPLLGWVGDAAAYGRSSKSAFSVRRCPTLSAPLPTAF